MSTSTRSSGRGTKRARPDADSVAGRAVHGGKGEHVCKTCRKAFGAAGTLKRHIRTVHGGEKPHKCKTCHKAFGQAGHLKRHIRTKHGSIAANDERDRECPICFEPDTNMPELTCGHKICAGCQVSLCSKTSNGRAKRTRGNGYFECPMCRKRVRIDLQ